MQVVPLPKDEPDPTLPPEAPQHVKLTHHPNPPFARRDQQGVDSSDQEVSSYKPKGWPGSNSQVGARIGGGGQGYNVPDDSSRSSRKLSPGLLAIKRGPPPPEKRSIAPAFALRVHEVSPNWRMNFRPGFKGKDAGIYRAEKYAQEPPDSEDTKDLEERLNRKRKERAQKGVIEGAARGHSPNVPFFWQTKECNEAFGQNPKYLPYKLYMNTRDEVADRARTKSKNAINKSSKGKKAVSKTPGKTNKVYTTTELQTSQAKAKSRKHNITSGFKVRAIEDPDEPNHLILRRMLNSQGTEYFGESMPNDPYTIKHKNNALNHEVSLAKNRLEHTMDKAGNIRIGNVQGVLESQMIWKAKSHLKNYEEMRIITEGHRLFNLFHNLSVLIAAPHCYVMFGLVEGKDTNIPQPSWLGNSTKLPFYKTLLRQNFSIREYCKEGTDPRLCNIIWSSSHKNRINGFHPTTIKTARPCVDIVPYNDIRYLRGTLIQSKVEELSNQCRMLRLFKTSMLQDVYKNTFQTIVNRFMCINVISEQLVIENHIPGMEIYANLASLYQCVGQSRFGGNEAWIERSRVVRTTPIMLNGDKFTIPKIKNIGIIKRGETSLETSVFTTLIEAEHILNRRYGVKVNKDNERSISPMRGSEEDNRRGYESAKKRTIAEKSNYYTTQSQMMDASYFTVTDNGKGEFTPDGKPKKWKFLEQPHLLLQDYIDDVLLYKERKFDLRFYLLVVKMFDNMTAYLYNDGFGTFCSIPYKDDTKTDKNAGFTANYFQSMRNAIFNDRS